MAALPYMQLYVADYLADTPHLTTEEHGAYLLLLFSYWQTGKPLRVDRLASAARISNERWTDVKRSLMDFFKEVDGVWIHPRVEKDLEKVATKSGKNSEAGKASAAARAFAKQQLERLAGKVDSTNVPTNVERPLSRRSTIEDTDTDTDKRPCPQQAENGHQFKFSEIQAAYNEICGSVLPKCKAVTDKRKRQVKRMVDLEFNGKRPFREHGIGMWQSYFRDCLTNKHWVGDNDRGWRADFDFLTKPDNAIKLLERICG